jgi:hypothetical protein
MNHIYSSFKPNAMLKKALIPTVAFFLIHFTASAQLQHLNLNVSMQGGYSVLEHNTDFQNTPLEALYDFIIDLPVAKDLTWEDFHAAYDIKDHFGQPRMGFSAQLTYKDWPIKFIGDAMSSSSSYTRSAYSVTAGLGKDFYIADSSWYCSFLGGYKYLIKDYGFGANTIVNSIGRKESREDAAQFFGPVEAIGRPSGDLFVLRAGFAKTLDWYYRWSVGVEGFYELDLTDKLVRSARMTNYGAVLYVRCKIFGRNEEPSRFYPNPGGGRNNYRN